MTDSGQLIGFALYVGAFGLILLGAYGLAARHNLVRVLLALTVLEAGVNLFLVAVGFRPEAVAPILVGGAVPGPMVDPIPQALILTAIVIGVGVLALGLALVVRVHQTTGSLDTRVVAEALAREDSAAGPPAARAGGTNP